jgi:hypothetical protein
LSFTVFSGRVHIPTFPVPVKYILDPPLFEFQYPELVVHWSIPDEENPDTTCHGRQDAAGQRKFEKY